MQRPVLKRKIAKSNGWTPQRRAAQSARIRADRIWLKSTGPRSEDGKARASANSLKTGRFSRRSRAIMRRLRVALRAQRDYMKHCDVVWRHERLGRAIDQQALCRHGVAVTAMLHDAYLGTFALEGMAF